MYEEYWGLKEKPFENTPDPRFLYHSQQHEEALMRLLYAVEERKGAAIFSGEFGCGKTILSRVLLDRIDPNRFQVALLTNSKLPSIELLREIARQLGATDLPERKSDLLNALNDILNRNASINKHTVVIIDEAQLIEEREVFEELRLLLNLQLNNQFLLTLLLLGQPELREKVNKIPQLRQRIGIRHHLGFLTEEETGLYITHRLKTAGREKEIFTDETAKLIYGYSKGCPRMINNICDLSLLAGFGQKVEKIDGDIVAEVVKDLREW